MKGHREFPNGTVRIRAAKWPALYPTTPERIGASVMQAVIGLPMRLKAHRAAHGLSLRDVEAATGVSNATVLHVERGGDYRVSTLLALVEWLDRVQ